MNNREIRLECLKLASENTRDFDTTMKLAKAFEEYVSGPKEGEDSSEKTNKSSSKKTSKVDNARDLF
jgi:hypothetical protein